MVFQREENRGRKYLNSHTRHGLILELCILGTFPTDTGKALRTEPQLTSQTNNPEWHVHETNPEQ